MKRNATRYLTEWKNRAQHKPLILRGARQVGKTWLVDRFAESFKHYIKLDFEENNNAVSFFRDNNVDRIVEELTLSTEIPIINGKTLLFFDCFK